MPILIGPLDCAWLPPSAAHAVLALKPSATPRLRMLPLNARMSPRLPGHGRAVGVRLVAHGPGGDLGSGLHAELGEDVLEMGLDGARRHKQLLGNLTVGQPARDQLRD